MRIDDMNVYKGLYAVSGMDISAICSIMLGTCCHFVSICAS